MSLRRLALWSASGVHADKVISADCHFDSKGQVKCDDSQENAHKHMFTRGEDNRVLTQISALQKKKSGEIRELKFHYRTEKQQGFVGSGRSNKDSYIHYKITDETKESDESDTAKDTKWMHESVEPGFSIICFDHLESPHSIHTDKLGSGLRFLLASDDMRKKIVDSQWTGVITQNNDKQKKHHEFVEFKKNGLKFELPEPNQDWKNHHVVDGVTTYAGGKYETYTSRDSLGNKKQSWEFVGKREQDFASKFGCYNYNLSNVPATNVLPRLLRMPWENKLKKKFSNPESGERYPHVFTPVAEKNIWDPVELVSLDSDADDKTTHAIKTPVVQVSQLPNADNVKTPVDTVSQLPKTDNVKTTLDKVSQLPNTDSIKTPDQVSQLPNTDDNTRKNALASTVALVGVVSAAIVGTKSLRRTQSGFFADKASVEDDDKYSKTETDDGKNSDSKKLTFNREDPINDPFNRHVIQSANSQSANSHVASVGAAALNYEAIDNDSDSTAREKGETQTKNRGKTRAVIITMMILFFLLASGAALFFLYRRRGSDKESSSESISRDGVPSTSVSDSATVTVGASSMPLGEGTIRIIRNHDDDTLPNHGTNRNHTNRNHSTTNGNSKRRYSDASDTVYDSYSPSFALTPSFAPNESAPESSRPHAADPGPGSGLVGIDTDLNMADFSRFISGELGNNELVLADNDDPESIFSVEAEAVAQKYFYPSAASKSSRLVPGNVTNLQQGARPGGAVLSNLEGVINSQHEYPANMGNSQTLSSGNLGSQNHTPNSTQNEFDAMKNRLGLDQLLSNNRSGFSNGSQLSVLCSGGNMACYMRSGAPSNRSCYSGLASGELIPGSQNCFLEKSKKESP